MAEQRNPYRGGRAWLQIRFRAPDGSAHVLDLLADTGCPVALVLRPEMLDVLRVRPSRPHSSNFGLMTGGWVQPDDPELGQTAQLHAFGNQAAADMAARSDPGFAGLVGLPVLRRGEYGGDADTFWFRYPPAA